MNPIPFEHIARLPAPTDNAGVAIQTIEAGTPIEIGDRVVTISHTVLVGHRFAVREIAHGERLLSWGQTFGTATQTIQAGDYVVNADVLAELRRRSLQISLPENANFQNELEPYQFDAANFKPAPPLPRYAEMRTFMGYAREGERGVGTRNTIILLGTSALVAGFVRKLEATLQHHLSDYPHIDGIVAVAHTEGAHGKANNQALMLRTLAGFVVHPNVGAVLIVDAGHETLNNALLQDYLTDNAYPLDAVPHHFMSLSASFDADLARGKAIVDDWLPLVNAMSRTPQPLAELKIALQCGGSDAFSGISGNPLAAWVTREIIRYGGCANLAETDELIGAESYVLDKVHDAATAEKFLSFVERFKERVAWHGHSADGNPSGGNKFRGLYNIYLKSLGAATKRHPDVRLEAVIDYGELMREAGYYFMDSPGNDLESVAGQVASGCNLIFFVTGNGSITNFPFVPTIKIVTTTERYHLLANDMDINAGAYLDGVPLAQVGQDTLAYTVDVASGQLSVGEKAGHSQVQIWRDWQLTQAIALDTVTDRPVSGQPIAIDLDISVPDVPIVMYRDGDTLASERVGLILPTSLCSGQIARMCVDTLNKHPMLAHSSLSRFVTLTHTEGCGGSVNSEFKETLLGYLQHPLVKHALLLEHGCEATHNDYFRHALHDAGLNASDYGWASIQLDGGIQAVIQKMALWFEQQVDMETSSETITTGLQALRIAIVSASDLAHTHILADLTRMIVKAGGTVILGEQDRLLKSDFVIQIKPDGAMMPTVTYAGQVSGAGFHVMAMPTHDWSETLTGLGTQVDVILAVNHQPLAGHPMIPMLQISEQAHSQTDFVLGEDISSLALLTRIADTLSRTYTPQAMQAGHINFQVTRGLLGVSL
ncbi:MAG: UxaA family hydrolase [Anaerolineae bacterium]